MKLLLSIRQWVYIIENLDASKTAPLTTVGGFALQANGYFKDHKKNRS